MKSIHMKKLSILLAFTMLSISLFAQDAIIDEVNDATLQKYIELAKKNFPRKKAFDTRVDRSKSALNMAKSSWLDIFNGGYYFSPSSSSGTFISPGGAAGPGGASSQTGQFVVRGFSAGVSVNLGNLISKPSIVKMAKADYELAKLESTEYDNTLTTEVKSRYYDYLLAKKQLALRTVAAENYKTVINDAKLKYERAEIAIEVYTASRTLATESESQALTAEVTFLKAKNALEDVIGTKLENVK